ncbi:hypothetical protein BRADI_4g37940v3 [Brachypodium distachyon]|uniref:AAA+ ATPase domain-containing protein n=2 Tax=Brachypodium distachyon TaxID=15368 RepID=A0A2K2CSZ5_BRADI|nr:hypothetical protein BRADI_4g37940v3 [Brachypodium distachyon]
MEHAMLERREEAARLETAELRSLARSLEELYSHATTGRADIVAQLLEVIDDEDRRAVVSLGDDRALCVPVLGAVDRALLTPGANVALRDSARAPTLLDVLPARDAAWASPLVSESPSVTYADVAGCEQQKRELPEAIELPLTHPELFASAGIDPPRGVLLHGPPGTGKTMLARAMAHHVSSSSSGARASATFIAVSGSELVHCHGGEGPRMVRDLFRTARARAPAVVFFDEVDAIALSRADSDSAADREVHRILIELLAQMDGFDQSASVSVIMATNRDPDELDAALLRPGRVDRKVEFTLPGRKDKRLMYAKCTSGMSLGDGVDYLDHLAARDDGMSAAEVDAVCREAGMCAVRARRSVVTREDFQEGYRKVAANVVRGADQFYFYS